MKRLIYAKPGKNYKLLSIREAVKELSVGIGQGYVKCGCNGQCATYRCSCKKSGITCSSMAMPWQSIYLQKQLKLEKILSLTNLFQSNLAHIFGIYSINFDSIDF